MVEWSLPEERDRLTKAQWMALFLKQNGKCACGCERLLQVKGATEVDAHPAIDEHLKPLSMGAGNDMANRQLWAKPCATVKTAEEAPRRAKSNRIRAKHIGAPKARKGRAIIGSKASGFKFDWKLGRMVRRHARD